jgi:hypothetical protein
MPGKKLPVLEVGDLLITNDGNGIIFYNDGTNAQVGAWETLYTPSNQNAAGWFKMRYMSGSTSTLTTGYVPFYSNYKA